MWNQLKVLFIQFQKTYQSLKIKISTSEVNQSQANFGNPAERGKFYHKPIYLIGRAINEYNKKTEILEQLNVLGCNGGKIMSLF